MAEGKVVYVKLAALHPFHTFREHPYKVTDDERMNELVGTIKEHGVMTPIIVRPDKYGVGYEVIAARRRYHGSGDGLDEIPCITREMNDPEAAWERRISNKQRGEAGKRSAETVVEYKAWIIKIAMGTYVVLGRHGTPRRCSLVLGMGDPPLKNDVYKKASRKN